MRKALHISLTLFALSLLWETHTRAYLENISQHIVSPMATSRQKVEALLEWMQLERAKEPLSNSFDRLLNREPVVNLSHRDLLTICGTSANGFVNLASNMNIPVRRLLLMDEHYDSYHVVSEVKINNEWTVVDPSRGIFLNKTRQQMAGNTDHIRLAKIPIIGRHLQGFLIRNYPHWSDFMYLSFILERESLLACLGSGLLTILFAWGCFRRKHQKDNEAKVLLTSAQQAQKDAAEVEFRLLSEQ